MLFCNQVGIVKGYFLQTFDIIRPHLKNLRRWDAWHSGFIGFIFFIVFGSLLLGSPIIAKEPLPAEFSGVGITEHLSEQIPLDTVFTNSRGDTIPLQNLFAHSRPTFLNFVYFNCPMLCGLVMDSFSESLSQLDLPIGTAFDIITISIDPTDTPENASAYKQKYLAKHGLSQNSVNWSFLVGSQGSIEAITKAVGFQYRYIQDTQDYSHNAALMVLSKGGIISRYIYGIEYAPFTLKMSILEAQKGKTASVFEKTLLYCYQYDPNRNSYSFQAFRLMQIGGGLTLLFLLIYVILFSKKRHHSRSTTKK